MNTRGGFRLPGVTDRHEVFRHRDATHQILEEINASADVSQRRLSANLGIALGLTNSLVKGLVRRGWVRVSRVQPRRVRYLLTPTGLAEKARLSRQALQQALERYRTARVQVHEMFAVTSAGWDPGAAGVKPVVFYGSGELAEIGFICLQETDLTLVAVVDTCGRQRFFDVPTFAPDRVADALELAGPHARLLVMAAVRSESLEQELAAGGVPAHTAVWF
jgi:DNA-binding MarR family transcriptional regulator